MSSIDNQTLALAGMMQACKLVQELAYQGKIEHQSAFDASIASLFSFNPTDTADTFGGVTGVHQGLDVLTGLLTGSNRQPADMELTRYGVTLMAITKQFLNADGMAAAVHARLEELEPAFKEYGADDGLVASINQIYRETISTLSARIVVNGERNWLDDPVIAAKIRSLLLAGIRSTILWQQVGGSRWMLLLRRGKYLESAQRLRQRQYT